MNRSQAHQILGTNPQSTEDEIKKAYRRLAMKLHPDRTPEEYKDTAEAKFKEMKQAYELLSGKEDPTPNTEFRTGTYGAGGGSYNDILRKMREAMGSGFTEYQFTNGDYQKKMTYVTQIHITLEEAFAGCVKTSVFPNANGDGNGPIEIKIPAGVSDRTVVHTMEKDSNVYKAVVHITTEYKVEYAHPFANAVGAGSIMREYHLNPLTMIMGGFTSVKTIDGSTIAVRIPPGIEAGTILKIKGKGYWAGTKCQHRGDCFLRMIPAIQKLDAMDTELLREFKKALDAHLTMKDAGEIKA